MAGGNDKTKKLVSGREGLSKLSGSPFTLPSPPWSFTSFTFSLLAEEWTGSGLVGHFDQLSPNNTILRGEHYTPYPGAEGLPLSGGDSTPAQHG